MSRTVENTVLIDFIKEKESLVIKLSKFTKITGTQQTTIDNRYTCRCKKENYVRRVIC